MEEEILGKALNGMCSLFKIAQGKRLTLSHYRWQSLSIFDGLESVLHALHSVECTQVMELQEASYFLRSSDDEKFFTVSYFTVSHHQFTELPLLSSPLKFSNVALPSLPRSNVKSRRNSIPSRAGIVATSSGPCTIRPSNAESPLTSCTCTHPSNLNRPVQATQCFSMSAHCASLCPDSVPLPYLVTIALLCLNHKSWKRMKGMLSEKLNLE